MEDISEETIAGVRKAQTTGLLSNTGLYGYDLSNYVSLIPVVVPFREMLARVKSPQGNPAAYWRAFLNVTNSQPDPAVAFDYAASEIVFNEQDFAAKYKKIAFAGLVTQDAKDLATGYADPYAISLFQCLNQLMIGEDRKGIGGQSFALPQPAAPSLTQVATGGTIGATQVYVGVAARTGSGYFYGSGNSQGNSASTTFASGSTNSVTATVGAVKGAVLYDWFQSSNGTTWYYYTSTTVNAVTMTRVIGANQSLPSGTGFPDLTTQWKGSTGVPTFNAAADNGSANANDIDGLLATLTGDYNSNGNWVQAGTATPNPAVFNSLNGAALTLTGGTVTEIEADIFLPLWQQVKCSPTAIMVNAVQAQEIANLVLGANSAVTYLQTDSSGRVNATAGGRIGHIVNAPAGGTVVPIEVHPSVPPGTIIGRTDHVPFPQSDIGNVLELRTLRDTSQFDYGVNRNPGVSGGGPRIEFEIITEAAFVNRAPVAMAVLSNVA
jgi:hypothetical protein